MKQTRHALVSLGLAAVLATGLACAQGATSTPSQTAGQPSVQGSIRVPQDQTTEGGEASSLQALAKITMQAAIQAAQQSLGVSDAPSSAQLGNDNGFLTWEIVIGGQEVQVDAGTGSVLATQAVGAESASSAGEQAGNQEDAGSTGNEEADATGAQAGETQEDNQSGHGGSWGGAGQENDNGSEAAGAEDGPDTNGTEAPEQQPATPAPNGI